MTHLDWIIISYVLNLLLGIYGIGLMINSNKFGSFKQFIFFTCTMLLLVVSHALVPLYIINFVYEKFFKKS